MIAEYLTAISTSPWNNDHFYDFEAPGNDNSLSYYNDLKLTSRGTSRHSSECSDREAELFCTDSWFTDYDSVVTSAESLPDITLVNSYLDDSDGYQGLESPNVSSCGTDDDDDGRFSLNSDDEDKAEDEDDDIYPSPKKSKRNLYDVTWSEMSKEEHITTIEELISLISEKMNLRDQLEIIRIINPKAEVSPTANEFTIELEWLTDEKLHRIRDYITQTSKLSNLESSKEDDEEEDEKCSTKSTSSKRRQSKRNARERRQQMRAQMLRQRKENKQAVKEKKSGLFRNEKVLSVERVQDDCEEVDILG